MPVPATVLLWNEREGGGQGKMWRGVVVVVVEGGIELLCLEGVRMMMARGRSDSFASAGNEGEWEREGERESRSFGNSSSHGRAGSDKMHVVVAWGVGEAFFCLFACSSSSNSIVSYSSTYREGRLQQHQQQRRRQQHQQHYELQ